MAKKANKAKPSDSDGGGGVPEWVVTYGDMMSLLLTFFIMLVSLTEVVDDDKYRAILDALQEYIGYQSGPVAPPGEEFPLNGLIAALRTLGSYSDEDAGYGGVKQKAVLGDQTRVYRTREGKSRIVREPVTFAPGKADLSESARKELAAITTELIGKPNKVVIRAHCAPSPLPRESPHADKYALTYARGRHVYDFLKEQGVDEKRMRVNALADTEPLAGSSEGRKLALDRVEVVILDAFSREFVGPREEGG